jgi:hypothetical protein
MVAQSTLIDGLLGNDIARSKEHLSKGNQQLSDREIVEMEHTAVVTHCVRKGR